MILGITAGALASDDTFDGFTLPVEWHFIAEAVDADNTEYGWADGVDYNGTTLDTTNTQFNSVTFRTFPVDGSNSTFLMILNSALASVPSTFFTHVRIYDAGDALILDLPRESASGSGGNPADWSWNTTGPAFEFADATTYTLALVYDPPPQPVPVEWVFTAAAIDAFNAGYYRSSGSDVLGATISTTGDWFVTVEMISTNNTDDSIGDFHINLTPSYPDIYVDYTHARIYDDTDTLLATLVLATADTVATGSWIWSSFPPVFEFEDATDYKVVLSNS